MEAVSCEVANAKSDLNGLVEGLCQGTLDLYAVSVTMQTSFWGKQVSS